MLEILNQLDTNLFLWINTQHNSFFDEVMLAVSYNKFLMLLIISAVFLLGFFDLKKAFFKVIILSIVAFGLSDSVSTKVFKDNFKRLRPCHNPNLANKVHLAGKKCWGGKYGFVSSHASNSFAIAFFFWLILVNRRKILSLFLVYAGLVSYSRVYLAKHYPGDIFCGALLGMGISYLIYSLYRKIQKKETIQGS